VFTAFEQNCELRAAVQRQGDDKVALYYELRNKGDAAVFVLHGVEPEEAPYYVERTARGLSIAHKIIAPPPGLELERPEVPLAARVDPGDRFRKKIELTLPLRECVPYPHLQPKRERPSGYLVLEGWLEVGFCAPDDPDAAREAGEGWILPGAMAAKQRIATVGPLGRFAFVPRR